AGDPDLRTAHRFLPRGPAYPEDCRSLPPRPSPPGVGKGGALRSTLSLSVPTVEGSSRGELPGPPGVEEVLLGIAGQLAPAVPGKASDRLVLAVGKALLGARRGVRQVARQLSRIQ